MVMRLLTLFALGVACSAHNITRILERRPEFATFNLFLTETHLAAEINSRSTITVLAVDNAGMAALLAASPTVSTVRNALSLHILLDYFGTEKLHQISKGSAVAATVFQASGSAPGSSGFVNITNARGGKVLFGPKNNNGTLPVQFVKSVQEIPYNISVIQVSSLIPSDVADAPTPGPAEMNLTDIMAAHGCKAFADTLLTKTQALKTYQDNLEGGLTVFCPLDAAFTAFLPRYKNLTAEGKQSFLEFMSVPVYMSMSHMKSNNGATTTLATDGAKKYQFTIQNDGEDVTLMTKAVTAAVTGTLIDEQPLAIYAIDRVLLPEELFKDSSDASAAPTSHPGGPRKPELLPLGESPAESPRSDVAGAPERSAARRVPGAGTLAAILFLCVLASGLPVL